MKLNDALNLAAAGYHVFPLLPGKKTPPEEMKGYPQKATRNADQIIEWWSKNPHYNIGISTSAYGDSHYLLAFDIDDKPGKKGAVTYATAAAMGYDFPDTYRQETPSGGWHLLYYSDVMCAGTVQVFGAEFYNGEHGQSGIDTRGKGNYVVGAGSIVRAGSYSSVVRAPARAPEWAARMFTWVLKATDLSSIDLSQIDQERAIQAAEAFLETAPVATDGYRNESLYLTATEVKDFGVTPSDCYSLLLRLWNPRCSPPLGDDEIAKVVRNAYRYGQSTPGASAPENLFTKKSKPKAATPDRPPGSVAEDAKESEAESSEAASASGDSEATGITATVAAVNRKYAFALVGNSGVVLYETKDHKKQFKLKMLSVDTFKNQLAGEKLWTADGEANERWRIWLYHLNRRGYDDLVFSPNEDVDPRFYNLWRGFAYTPLETGATASPQATAALEAWIEHINENATQDANHARWMTSWFAFLVQRPEAKQEQLTSIVLRGNKGAGKDSLVNRYGALFGPHFLSTARRRYLVGQFNSALENKLLFVLNEAFWAHDNAVRSTLNTLVTESTHYIERKGLEPYQVDNHVRLIVMGNEDTLVPSSWDERRWAVFDMKPGPKHSKRDKAERRAFFRNMRVGMEANGGEGYRLLMRYLLQYDTSHSDINEVPDTEAAQEQKVAGLDDVHTWWHESLAAGRIVAADFSNGWPARLETTLFRDAFRNWRRLNGRNGKEPHEVTVGKRLRECLPSLDSGQKMKTTGANAYTFPTLDICRQEWDKFIGANGTNGGKW